MTFSATAVVGTFGHLVYRIATIILVLLLIYVGGKIARKLFNVFREILVMCSVAFGWRWMPTIKSLRIQPYLCRSEELDDVSIEECFRFHFQSFRILDETKTEEEKFAIYKKVLLSYTYTLFSREKTDGSLRGLCLFGVEHRGTHTLIKSELFLTHNHYRGGPWRRLVLASLIIRELVLHPLVPVYNIGKLVTYKSYLMLTPFPDGHPRYDKPAPEEYKKVAEDYVRTIDARMEDYNRDTFVLHRRVGAVDERLATISESDLQNPHIRFFKERNPGWREGDQLVTLIKMTWRTLLTNLVTVALRQFRQPPPTRGTNVPRGNATGGNVNRKKVQKLQSRLKRGLTFQDKEGALHSIRYHSQHHHQHDDDSDGHYSYIEKLYGHVDDEEYSVDF